MTEAPSRGRRPAPSGGLEAGNELNGRYRIIRQLGAGGMGAVYEAEQIKLRRRVAIKVMHPEQAARNKSSKRFLREARAASAIEHRNVVDILDFGELADGTTYLVMELLQGTDLSSLLRKQGTMDWPRARGILIQVLRGLKAAHDNKIIHRDIKPANIFLLDPDDEYAKDDRVKVLDFGIARFVQADDETQELTGTTEMLGTVPYMAPELGLKQPATVQSDLYAVGVMAYKMLTGLTPFGGGTALQVLYAHIHEPVPSPRRIQPSIPETVEAVILRALAKNPDERFQDTDALRRALVSISDDGTITSTELIDALRTLPFPPLDGSPALFRTLTATTQTPRGAQFRMLVIVGLLTVVLGVIAWNRWGSEPSVQAVAPVAAMGEEKPTRPTPAEVGGTTRGGTTSGGTTSGGTTSGGTTNGGTTSGGTTGTGTTRTGTTGEEDNDVTGDPTGSASDGDDSVLKIVRFINQLGRSVKIFSRDEGGDEELRSALSAGQVLELQTNIGQRWVVRGAANSRILRTMMVEQDGQTIVIRRKIKKLKKPAPKSKPVDATSPIEAPTTVPKTLSKADMKSVSMAAKKKSRGCGERHGNLYKTVEVEIHVEPNGRVSKASAPALKGTTLGTCVANAINTTAANRRPCRKSALLSN